MLAEGRQGSGSQRGDREGCPGDESGRQSSRHSSRATTPALFIHAPGWAHRRSEQRPLGGDTVAPGEAVGTQLPLAQDAVFEILMDHLGRLPAALIVCMGGL
jgi:hypothetical protein